MKIYIKPIVLTIFIILFIGYEYAKVDSVYTEFTIENSMLKNKIESRVLTNESLSKEQLIEILKTVTPRDYEHVIIYELYKHVILLILLFGVTSFSVVILDFKWPRKVIKENKSKNN